MDFGHSPKAREYAERVAVFIRDEIDPIEPAYHRDVAASDDPWTPLPLIANLQAFDDQAMTADCRAALLECRDEEGRRQVRAWASADPMRLSQSWWACR